MLSSQWGLLSSCLKWRLKKSTKKGLSIYFLFSQIFIHLIASRQFQIPEKPHSQSPVRSDDLKVKTRVREVGTLCNIQIYFSNTSLITTILLSVENADIAQSLPRICCPVMRIIFQRFHGTKFPSFWHKSNETWVLFIYACISMCKLL